MACSGCAARRAWLKKMARLAYERTFGRKTDRGDHRPDGSNNTPGGIQ